MNVVLLSGGSGRRLCIEKPEAFNEDFNIASYQPITVLELAEIIWKKINKDKPFSYVSDKPYPYDVQVRVASTEKAKRLLGFEAKTSLSDALNEVIPWISEQISLGNI